MSHPLASVERLLPAEAARYLGLSTATLAKMRCLGGSPPFLKFGRKVLYERSALDRWADARRVQSTSDSDRLPKRLTDGQDYSNAA